MKMLCHKIIGYRIFLIPYLIIPLLHCKMHETTTNWRRSLRIAQVAPMFEGIPPTRSVTAGIASRNVHYLTEELVKRGHDVTLFGPYGSETSAKLVSHPNLPPINKVENQAKTLLPYAWQLEQVRRRVDEFDVIHFHTIEHMNSVEAFVNKTVTTLYMSKYNMDEMAPLFELFHHDHMAFVALTLDQQKHAAPMRPKFVAQIYPGIPENLYQFVSSRPKLNDDTKNTTNNAEENRTPNSNGYLAFLGRMEPDKGHQQAIAIAVQAGIPLRIGTGQQSKDMDLYYQQEVKPLVKKHADLVEYIGEIKEQDKGDFLGNALALLVLPTDEDDPVELAMIEAMSMGTPVVTHRNGPIEEVVESMVTGLMFSTLSEGVKMVKTVTKISRTVVLNAFKKRWTVARMADQYEQIYAQILDKTERLMHANQCAAMKKKH